ncbi:MAG TPA: hypothetical protein PKY38_03525 [Opitutaceae bacterium]|nr:hypothetical protein [Opitutaceae bacterium]
MKKAALIARWRDVRVWIWPLAAFAAWWLDRDWSPDHLVWRDPAGGVIVSRSAGALIWPGALTLAAAVGTVRAWAGRSVLNGAYLAGCLLVLVVFGAVSWARLSYRLQVDATRATVRSHGVYWRVIEREQLARVDEVAVVRRGANVLWPALVKKDGEKIHVRGPGAWEFAGALAQLWRVPAVRQTGEADG